MDVEVVVGWLVSRIVSSSLKISTAGKGGLGLLGVWKGEKEGRDLGCFLQ